MARPLNERFPVTGADRFMELAGAETGPGNAGWQRLADTALVPAAGAGPDWLGSLMEALGGEARLLMVHRGDAIAALMAVTVKGLQAGYPATVAVGWHSDLTFAGTPLIAGRDAAGAVAGLLDEARRQAGASALLINGMEADARLLQAIAAAAAGRGLSWQILSRHQRAALRVRDEPFEAWLKRSFPTKRRREYRRLKARLGEAGKLGFDGLGKGEPLSPWIDQFIALEQAGWKGQRGTAIGCDPALTAALRLGLERLHRRGDLGFWRLSIDDRPVAMLFAPMAQERAWLLKIAHDEAFARFSPGLLIILEATRELLAAGRFALIDSCAMPGHPLIEHLWADRIDICDVMIATPGTSARLFGLLVAVERTRRRLRAAGKRAFHALTGRRVK